jgi:hypothetical protein
MWRLKPTDVEVVGSRAEVLVRGQISVVTQAMPLASSHSPQSAEHRG